MDSSYLTNPIILLIDTFSSLYILAVLLRFLMQWNGTSFYNPVAQMLLRVTHPPLRFLRRFVPPIGRIDTSSLLLVWLLQMLANFAILLLKGVDVKFGALAVLSCADLLALFINIYIFAVFARALISWLSPGNYSPAAAILESLTDPVLVLARRVVPDLAGIDWSPLVVILFLHLAKMILLPPMQQLAGLLG